VDGGQARVLLAIGTAGTAGAARARHFPEVPTAAERDWQIPSNSWQGLLAAGATPPSLLDRIRAGVGRYAADPAARRLASDRGVDLMCSTADEFGARLAGDAKVWADVARALGVEPQ
jgi:tripartite-type tricarboxylate transporter receptor subunit TctC